MILGLRSRKSLSKFDTAFFPISGYPGDLMRLWWRIVRVCITQLNPSDHDVKCSRKKTHPPRFSGMCSCAFFALSEPSSPPGGGGVAGPAVGVADCFGPLLGTRQQATKFNEDYKRSAKRHGDNKPFLVRKAFLKRVLMERYRHKL